MGISDVLFRPVRQKVLNLLYGHPGARFFQQEIIHFVGLGSGATQRELSQLLEAGIVSRTWEGRQAYYQANPESPVYPELVGMVRKTSGIATFLTTVLEPLKDWIDYAFLDGEIAPLGPLQMVVVGDVSLRTLTEALQPAEDRLGRKIHVSLQIVAGLRRKTYAPKTFLIGDAVTFARASAPLSSPPPLLETVPPRKSKSR